MSQKLIFFIFLFIYNLGYGQSKRVYLSMNGKIKVLFGLEIHVPKDAVVELLPIHRITTTDSLGQFQFSELDYGIYKIRILDFNFKPEEYEVNLLSKPIKNFEFLIIADCEVNKKNAELDIKRAKIKLLLSSGIAPTIFSNQSKVEKRYQFEYYDFGCISPATECMVEYNKTIFEYLDKKFGKRWRKDVRNDVVGLK